MWLGGFYRLPFKYISVLSTTTLLVTDCGILLLGFATWSFGVFSSPLFQVAYAFLWLLPLYKHWWRLWDGPD